MKYLHKFYNREDIPWVNLVWECYYTDGRLPGNTNRGSFWWRDVAKLIDKFKGMAKVNLQNGMTCFLWTDLWLDTVLATNYSKLFSFAKNKTITVSMAKATDSLHELFHLPLSEEAFAQFTHLQVILQNLQLT